MEIAKFYHRISVFTLQKKSSKSIFPFHAVQISNNSGPFSVWPREVTSLWGYDGPLAQLNPTSQLWGNDEPLNFSVLFELIIVN